MLRNQHFVCCCKNYFLTEQKEDLKADFEVSDNFREIEKTKTVSAFLVMEK